MLVQALAKYAETYLTRQLEDPTYEEKPVQYLLEIDETGKFLGIIPKVWFATVDGGKKQRTVKRTDTFLVPRSPVNRNTGIHPLLGCDAIQYVLGPNLDVWTKPNEKKKHANQHQGFVDLVKQAAAETDDPALKACAAFYANSEEVQKGREEMAANDTEGGPRVALAVRPGLDAEETGGPIIQRPAVKMFWQELYSKKFLERHAKGGEGICLISGQFGPLAVTHEKVMGVSSLGGQPSGVALMSFDKSAFRSYGWEQNQNSPVSLEQADAYVFALNDLLKPGLHRQGRSRNVVLRTRSDYAGVGFLYWTRDPADEDVVGLFEGADPEEVKKLLDAPFTGKPRENFQANQFYLLVVSGNGGRLTVRDWFYDSLERVTFNLREWFEGLSIADVFKRGEPAEPPRLWELLSCQTPQGREVNDKLNAERTMRLMGRALFGRPLSPSVLVAALNRLRAETGANRLATARIGLVRLCVNDILSQKEEGDKQMSNKLDPEIDNAAYICGRLLAVYEGLQYQAQRELNVTVADRYYSLASAYPQLAFPKLQDLSMAHLKKLRRENPRAAFALNRRISELMEKFPEGACFPSQLNLEDQGRFVIGYHHQKAEDARRAKEAKARKAETSADESTTDANDNIDSE